MKRSDYCREMEVEYYYYGYQMRYYVMKVYHYTCSTYCLYRWMEVVLVRYLFYMSLDQYVYVMCCDCWAIVFIVEVCEYIAVYDGFGMYVYV